MIIEPELQSFSARNPRRTGAAEGKASGCERQNGSAGSSRSAMLLAMLLSVRLAVLLAVV